jgi:hypothetical protein
VGRIQTTLAAGLALIAIALIATLSHAPATIARAPAVPPEKKVAFTTSDASGCQNGEALPGGTSAIRLGLFAVSSPGVAVEVFAGSHRITKGAIGPGWVGEGATVPVAEVPRGVAPVKVCFRVHPVVGRVEVLGRPTSPAEATVAEGKPLPGRISIEYLRSSHRSWWSRATSVARHLGFGHAARGAWDTLFVIVLAAGIVTLSSWLVVRDLR